ncbi:hypothetical protein RR46_06790 [Papilio xuthus]|uniref:Uncharacterized protein n=1 Tax=Papilio xuthus TaxID=66420 RepID=A0A194PRH8_PAPXU|nr:hypothetical protein RR46_06790 [Papilio xuthus]
MGGATEATQTLPPHLPKPPTELSPDRLALSWEVRAPRGPRLNYTAARPRALRPAARAPTSCAHIVFTLSFLWLG